MKPKKRIFLFPSFSLNQQRTVLPELLADLDQVGAPDDADLDVLW